MFYILKEKETNEVRHYRNDLENLKADCSFNNISINAYELIEDENEPQVGYDGKLYINGSTPDEPLDNLKSVKKQEINQAREQARLNECAEFNNDLFDIDDKAQANILAKVTTASLSSDDSMFTYRSKTNITHTFTKAEIIALGLAIGDKIDKVYEKSWLLKKKINEATTIEEIAEISWNTVIENT